MRLADLMLFLRVRNSWARSHLTYRLLRSVFTIAGAVRAAP